MATAQPVVKSPIAMAGAVAVCFVAAALGGVLTEPNLRWYAGLAKPGFTPANAVFPIVWTILYAMMAVAAWMVWRRGAEGDERRTALIFFGIQLALGVLWSFVFFWLHQIGYAMGGILLLLFAIVTTIVLFDRLSRVAALLLVPYVLWVAFASALNMSIWILNA